MKSSSEPGPGSDQQRRSQNPSQMPRIQHVSCAHAFSFSRLSAQSAKWSNADSSDASEAGFVTRLASTRTYDLLRRLFPANKETRVVSYLT